MDLDHATDEFPLFQEIPVFEFKVSGLDRIEPDVFLSSAEMHFYILRQNNKATPFVGRESGLGGQM